MPPPQRPIIEARRDQMFPILDPEEVDRLRRFGEVRDYRKGERPVTTGEVSPGMIVVLRGELAIRQHNELGPDQLIVTHGPGSFTAELAQLSGRPSLVDAEATSPVEALVIPSSRLRDVMVAEAELGERIMRALILRRVGLLEQGVGPIVVGRADDGDVLRIENFLERAGYPHRRLDPDTDADARALVERLHLTRADFPIVLSAGGRVLRNPTDAELAANLRLVSPIDPKILYDVAIIGAGPAGLAAAVYGASEGLGVIALDCRSFGGQAGASARIENYLGFPTGITGRALMARAFNQAQKFGAEMAIPDEAVRLTCEGDFPPGARFQIVLKNGERVSTRTVVLATGARYRRLDVSNLDQFESASVHYWASPLEAKLCEGREVALVGGGNSAGQAAVYLASVAAKVQLLCRAPDINANMSRYLVDRIRGLSNVEILEHTEVCALEGRDTVLETVRWRDRSSGKVTQQPIRHLFLFIGAEPNTDWLSQSDVALDAKGFVRTGLDVNGTKQALETSRDGVFAIGDVRAGSVKRVAAAVGEGAQVIATIHAFLARLRPASSAGGPHG